MTMDQCSRSRKVPGSPMSVLCSPDTKSSTQQRSIRAVGERVQVLLMTALLGSFATVSVRRFNARSSAIKKFVEHIPDTLYCNERGPYSTNDK